MRLNKQLRINTFGSFQVSADDHVYYDTTSRKSKVYNVLSYMVVFGGQPIPAETLAEVLWPDEEVDDPVNELRDIIIALNKSLASFCGEQQYVMCDSNCYSWNQNIDVRIDYKEFVMILESARDTSKPFSERSTLYNAAIDLYRGPFLVDSAIGKWALRLTDHYRRLFLQAVDEVAELYRGESMLEEIIILYGKALASEPFEEQLYIKQIKAMINNGDYSRAQQQYRFYERILKREFGARPSRDMQQLWRDIDRATTIKAGSLDDVTRTLAPENGSRGASFCDSDTFRRIYLMDRRSEERIDFPVFLALITYSLSPNTSEYVKDSKLKTAMKTMRQVLVSSLRTGDVVSQYSNCQFIVMLTVINADGGKSALRRMEGLFDSALLEDKGIINYNLSPIGISAKSQALRS